MRNKLLYRQQVRFEPMRQTMPVDHVFGGIDKYLHRIRLDPRLEQRRNDACPCGSGKKQRACCGAPDTTASYLLRA